ncbi:MAG TPA: ATP-binding protein [Dehalococcoidia bacterium]|nr:ATP-binding protein [Dehalococcoidia bacterium]
MAEADLHGAHILVVDDEEANVDLLEQVLGRAGFERVSGLTDPRRVLPLVSSAPVDLILLDLMMPQLDGFVLMEQVRGTQAEGDYLPILVLTADVTPPTRQRALASGATDFLTKPFDRIELVQRVSNLLETRLLYLRLQRQREALEQLYARAQSDLHERDAAQSAISHDLGQPLAAIRAVNRHLRRRAEAGVTIPPAELAGQLALIDDASAAMLGMLRELLDLVRLQAGRPLDLDYAQIDLNALVREQVQLHRATSSRHELRLIAASEPVVGEWDAARLARVVSNLLANAIKFSPAGGTITVATARERRNGQPQAVLRVRDEGIGIPADELGHLLQPFYRARNAAGALRGSGIGLAASRQIVEQHGGAIAIASREGAGTTVTVCLPLDEPIAELEGTG